MARIEVCKDMAVPVADVWEALADLGSHGAWMWDARSIRFVGAQTRGVGTRLEVETGVGPFHTRDILEVTGWEEGRSITVTHRGLVRGRGVLRVVGDDGHARVVWEEQLVFPWWLGGPVVAWVARPVLAAIMRGNLRRLESLVSSP
ncbi:MAG: SRPBCC family protein [Acidimicrobiia bacterium]